MEDFGACCKQALAKYHTQAAISYARVVLVSWLECEHSLYFRSTGWHTSADAADVVAFQCYGVGSLLDTPPRPLETFQECKSVGVNRRQYLPPLRAGASVDGSRVQSCMFPIPETTASSRQGCDEKFEEKTTLVLRIPYFIFHPTVATRATALHQFGNIPCDIRYPP